MDSVLVSRFAALWCGLKSRRGSQTWILGRGFLGCYRWATLTQFGLRVMDRTRPRSDGVVSFTRIAAILRHVFSLLSVTFSDIVSPSFSIFISLSTLLSSPTKFRSRWTSVEVDRKFSKNGFRIPSLMLRYIIYGIYLL